MCFKCHKRIRQTASGDWRWFNTYQLNYPEYGLIFYAGADSPRIATVDVATKELVEDIAEAGLPGDWSELGSIIHQECVDNITD
jgi:hypothetical protein